MGSGDKGEWTFLDIITLISFCIGLQNLEENLSQTDLHEADVENAKRQDTILAEIHEHLAAQDAKLDNILAILKENGGIIYDGGGDF